MTRVIKETASVCILAFALFLLLGLYVYPAEAFHCGGTALGHPGGNSFPCPNDDVDDVDPGDEIDDVDPGSDDIDDVDPTSPGSGGGSLRNPLQFNTINEFLGGVIDVLLILAVPIIVFFIIYAGFLYVTAQGDPGKIQTATTAFTWAIVGGVLILGAWVLVEVIQGTVDAVRR